MRHPAARSTYCRVLTSPSALLCHEWQQRHVSSPLDGSGKHALVLRARATGSARNDLRSVRKELAKLQVGLVVYRCGLLHTKSTYLAPRAAKL
jgi:hypothetical protein